MKNFFVIAAALLGGAILFFAAGLVTYFFSYQTLGIVLCSISIACAVSFLTIVAVGYSKIKKNDKKTPKDE